MNNGLSLMQPRTTRHAAASAAQQLSQQIGGATGGLANNRSGSGGKTSGLLRKVLLTIENNTITPELTVRSQRGHFGWTTLENTPIFFLYRNEEEKFVSTKILEISILSKYEQILHPSIFTCISLKCYQMLSQEVRLFNEIINFHCDNIYQTYFSTSDHLISLKEAENLIEFLNNVCKRLQQQQTPDDLNIVNINSSSINNKCGFVELDSEALVPYVVINKELHLPIFYFEGEVDNINTTSVEISGWDCAYLKFCCKVQQIRESLYNKPKHDVIKLSELKKHFSSETTFKICWPSSASKDLLLPHQGQTKK